MKTLFSEQPVVEFLREYELAMAADISAMAENVLLATEMPIQVNTTIKRFTIQLPSLTKHATVCKVERRVHAASEPDMQGSATETLHGTDVAVYTVPFSGDGELFDCYAEATAGNDIVVESLSSGNLILEWANFGRIAGKADVISEIKKLFLESVAQIEAGIEALRPTVEEYNRSIPERVKQLLNQRFNDVRSRKESGEELNPFK